MTFQNLTSHLQKNFGGMASGLMLTLAFPNTGWYLLAFFALVPWMISIKTLSVKESITSAFFMGMTHYLTLIYWIIPTVHVYGQLHIVLATATLVLLCLYLSIYPALFAFLFKKFANTSFLTPFLTAALWTGLEYIRAHALTGFAWGALGYSQYTNLHILQIADFSGVFGVSFLIVFVNTSIFLCFGAFKKKTRAACLWPVAATFIFLVSALLYGRYQINGVSTGIKEAPFAKISVIQGNIKQDIKWSAQFKNATVEKYIRLSNSVSDKAPDLIIWPETALPFYYGFDKGLSDQVDQCIRSVKTNFLIGSPAFERQNEKVHFYNRAYMLNRFSLVSGTYDKTHLVPFGEYVPFGDYLTFLGKITEHAGNFSRGSKTFEPLEFNDYKTGVLICFEILFPSISSGFVKNGADILTTITNDAWFGYTSAARQHFAIAVFRAVENRRSMARAANTGISGFIDPIGEIHSTTGLFQDQAVTMEMPALKRITFYTNYGDIFAWGCILAFCLAFVVKRREKREISVLGDKT